MRINTNVTAMNTLANLNAANAAKSSALEKLSSGYRINNASDDAAGLAISEKMKAQISGMNQATSNAQDGISLLQTAEGTLNEVNSMLGRMRDLAVQASNGTSTGDDRTKIDNEFSNLKSEISRISKSSKFNGISLFNTLVTTTTTTPACGGTPATTTTTTAENPNAKFTFQIGANASTFDQLTVTLSAMDSSALGLTNTAVTSATAAQTAIDTIDNAISKVLDVRANIGANENRLNHTINNLTTTSTNLSDANSRIRDVDMASEMSTFTKENILTQAATSMLSQANAMPNSVLSLLQG